MILNLKIFWVFEVKVSGWVSVKLLRVFLRVV